MRGNIMMWGQEIRRKGDHTNWRRKLRITVLFLWLLKIFFSLFLTPPFIMMMRRMFSSWLDSLLPHESWWWIPLFLSLKSLFTLFLKKTVIMIIIIIMMMLIFSLSSPHPFPLIRFISIIPLSLCLMTKTAFDGKGWRWLETLILFSCLTLFLFSSVFLL